VPNHTDVLHSKPIDAIFTVAYFRDVPLTTVRTSQGREKQSQPGSAALTSAGSVAGLFRLEGMPGCKVVLKCPSGPTLLGRYDRRRRSKRRWASHPDHRSFGQGRPSAQSGHWASPHAPSRTASAPQRRPHLRTAAHRGGHEAVSPCRLCGRSQRLSPLAGKGQ
jgi:hypothetical protein